MLDRAGARAIRFAFLTEEAVKDNFERFFLARKDGELDRRVRRQPCRFLGEAEGDGTAAKLVDQPARLGILTRPDPAFGDLLYLLLGHVPSRRDVVLEALVCLVEKRLETAVGARRELRCAAE